MNNEQSNKAGRRNFLKTISALPVLSGAAVMAMCSGGCSDSSTVAFTGEKVTLVLANETALLTVGGSIRRAFGANMNSNRPVIVVRTAQDKFRAMSSYCPHEGGSVGSPTSGKAVCSKHGEQFSVSEGNFGSNVGGENTANLQTFNVTFDQTAGTITIEF